MNGWTIAALYVLVCAVGISIWCGCEYVRDRRAEAARFDADLETLAAIYADIVVRALA